METHLKPPALDFSFISLVFFVIPLLVFLALLVSNLNWDEYAASELQTYCANLDIIYSCSLILTFSAISLGDYLNNAL